MNLSKTFRILCLCCLGTALYSCDNSDPYKNAPQSIQVLGVEATTNIDLTTRSDWKLYVSGYDYTFETHQGGFSASPMNPSKPYAFEVSANDKSGRAIITLMSEDYFKTRDAGSLPANLEDQSTPEKFISRDVLRGDYSGEAKENISVTLFHENALLMFKTVDLPADAEVYIYEHYNKQTITPLRDAEDPDSYKAIIFPGNYLATVTVIVKTKGKEYRNTISSGVKTRMNIPYPDGIGHSGVVTFTVQINENKLEIKDVELKEFEKNWPALP